MTVIELTFFQYSPTRPTLLASFNLVRSAWISRPMAARGWAAESVPPFSGLGGSRELPAAPPPQSPPAMSGCASLLCRYPYLSLTSFSSLQFSMLTSSPFLHTQALSTTQCVPAVAVAAAVARPAHGDGAQQRRLCKDIITAPRFFFGSR
jgi:hypothetical protein